jgi:undecaprenyl-diphosphatase
MPLYHILILALVQGISEFLPISSSGHLVLTHHLMGEGGQNLCWSANRTIDVAVHVGTLFSVLIYFRKDLIAMAGGILNPGSNGFNLGRNVLIASVPVIIAGYFLHQIQPSFMCLVEIMAWMTLVFGIVLLIADKFQSTKSVEDMSGGQAFLIGLSQALALVPGVSRSGITMTSARFLGFSRTEAARFSLLLSIIAITGAGAVNGYDLYQSGNMALGLNAFIAVILSFVSGYIAITLMMKWLSKATFKPFAIYRIILGILLLGLIYGGYF